MGYGNLTLSLFADFTVEILAQYNLGSEFVSSWFLFKKLMNWGSPSRPDCLSEPICSRFRNWVIMSNLSGSLMSCWIEVGQLYAMFCRMVVASSPELGTCAPKCATTLLFGCTTRCSLLGEHWLTIEVVVQVGTQVAFFGCTPSSGVDICIYGS